jgi:hypothetical protein
MSLISLVVLTSRAGALDGLLPCQRENPELWFSEQPADLEQAKMHCRRCPVRGSCLSGAVERREPFDHGAEESAGSPADEGRVLSLTTRRAPEQRSQGQRSQGQR